MTTAGSATRSSSPRASAAKLRRARSSSRSERLQRSMARSPPMPPASASSRGSPADAGLPRQRLGRRRAGGAGAGGRSLVTDGPIDAATFAGLLEMTGGDIEFVDELVDTYIADGDQQVAALRAAVASGSQDELVRPAHSLKSSSLNMGALALGELARGLEEAARSGAVADAADRVDAIAVAFADARHALLDERGRRAQS